MVATSRTALRPGGIRPLNLPRLLDVQADDEHRPLAIRQRSRWLTVTSVEETWRVEDEWWREEPVSRAYYEVVLEDGRRIALFRDECADSWYSIHA